MISYTKDENIKSALLQRKELEELTDIFFRDFSNTEHESNVRLSCTLGSGTIEELTLEELLGQIKSKNSLDDFAIYARDEGYTKTASLFFHDKFISLRVTGPDESWVIGFEKRVSDYLNSKRSQLWFINTNIGNLLEGAFYSLPFTLGMYVVFTSFGSIFFDINSPNPYLVILFFLTVLLIYLKSKLEFVRISLKDKPTFRDKWEMPLFISATVGTLLQAIFSLITFFQK